MNQSLEPLSQDALDLLRDADAPEPSPQAEGRVLSRLQLELPPLLPVPQPAFPTAPKPPALGQYGAPVAVGTLALGLALGAWLHQSLAEPRVEVRTVTVEVPAVAVAPAPEVAQVAPPARRPPSPKVAAAKEAGPDLDLARERQLIEQARSALVRGDAASAAAAAAQHASAFPQGRLAEERESLWIQALVTQGNFPAARARAERFRADFPSSLLLPAVDAALSTIPR